MKKLMILLFIFTLSCILFAEYIPVEIESQAEDYVGKMLVTKLRDIIRSSPSYELGYPSDVPHFKIILDTMDRYKGDRASEGISTIYSYIVLISMGNVNLYLFSNIGYAGSSTLDTVAYRIYSVMDDFIETLISYMSSDYFD